MVHKDPKTHDLQPDHDRVEEQTPRGWHNGVLHCYGGCGLRYADFPVDMSIPTPLWNRIAVGHPFDESQTDIDREGRGGVLCPTCIVKRLAALPGCTVVFAGIVATVAAFHSVEQKKETGLEFSLAASRDHPTLKESHQSADFAQGDYLTSVSSEGENLKASASRDHPTPEEPI